MRPRSVRPGFLLVQFRVTRECTLRCALLKTVYCWRWRVLLAPRCRTLPLLGAALCAVGLFVQPNLSVIEENHWRIVISFEYKITFKLPSLMTGVVTGIQCCNSYRQSASSAECLLFKLSVCIEVAEFSGYTHALCLIFCISFAVVSCLQSKNVLRCCYRSVVDLSMPALRYGRVEWLYGQ
jgi:hypothetical protein